MPLYPWQSVCLDKWLAHQGRGIVNVATGAGKTVLALAAAEKLAQQLKAESTVKTPRPPSAPKALPDKLKIKIVVPKTFLLAQWTNAIHTLLGVPHSQIGIFSGAYKSAVHHRFMIYVINSARHTLAPHILADFSQNNAVLLIADECHHYGTTENAKIFDFLPRMPANSRYFSLGLSATPFCENYQSILVPSLGREVYRFVFQDALAAGIIHPFTVFHVKLQFEPSEQETYQKLSAQLSALMQDLRERCPDIATGGGRSFFETLDNLIKMHRDYEIVELARAIKLTTYRRKDVIYHACARIKCVTDLTALIRPSAKILIFGERVEMADAVYPLLQRQHPNAVGIFHSKRHKKPGLAALRDFELGTRRILISCRTLDEGLNVTGTDVGIIMSSTGSDRQRIQRLGRVLRKKPTDTPAYFYYLYVGETTEESEILRNVSARVSERIKVIALTYDHKTGYFHNEDYETRANAVVLQRMAAGWSDIQLAELRRTLQLGITADDWLLSEAECLAKIKGAESKSARNYYISMYYLIRARKCGKF